VACVDRLTRFVLFRDVTNGNVVTGPPVEHGIDLNWAAGQLVVSNRNEATFSCIDSTNGAVTGSALGRGHSESRATDGAFVRVWTGGARLVEATQGSAFSISERGIETNDQYNVVSTHDLQIFAVRSVPGIDKNTLHRVSPSGRYALLRDGDVVDLVTLTEEGDATNVARIGKSDFAEWIGGDTLVYFDERDQRMWDARSPHRLWSLGKPALSSEQAGAAAGRWRFIAGEPSHLFDGNRLLPLAHSPGRQAQAGRFDPSGRYFAHGEGVPESESNSFIVANSVTFYDLNGAAPRRLTQVTGDGAWIGPGRFLVADGKQLTVVDLPRGRQTRLGPTDQWSVTGGPNGHARVGRELLRIEEDRIVERVKNCEDANGYFTPDGGLYVLSSQYRQAACDTHTGKLRGEKWMRISCANPDCRVLYAQDVWKSRLIRIGDGASLGLAWLDLPRGRFSPLLLTDDGRYQISPSIAPLVWLHDQDRLFRADTRPPVSGLVDALMAPAKERQ
jgi:hypothetical protein